MCKCCAVWHVGFLYLTGLFTLGVCLVKKGSPVDAEVLLTEAVSIYRTAFPDKKSTIANGKCHDCIVAEDNVHL